MALRPRRSKPGFFVCATIVQAPQRAAIEDSKMGIKRRSANWPLNIWDYQFLASLGTEYAGDRFVEQINELVEEVKGMINDRHMRALDKLEFLDAVQRLGLGYHFDTEIKDALGFIREQHWNGDGSEFTDLYSTALLFRLLRQHGFRIQQEVLDRFLKNDKFEGILDEDYVKGVLSLYEASFHGLRGEFIVDDAKIVALNCLKSLDSSKLKTFPHNLARKVERALDMPIRRRSNRFDARWFMDIYEQEPDTMPNLLRLAKLDYNLVQSHHRTEVAQLSLWWWELGVERFQVLRDRLMESYLAANITAFEPQWGDCRIMMTKIACLITIIDDVYDIFGTMEELELLTDFIERWDISDIDNLPPVMWSAYLALYNSTNDIAYQVMRQRGVNVLPYLRMMWARHCRGYLEEAKWQHGGCKPTFEEYITNGTNTVGGFIVLLNLFVGMANHLNKEALDFACSIPPIIYDSSLIIRLLNDLTSSPHEPEREDSVKAVQCYKNEHGVSIEEARKAIWVMVEDAWKSLNKQELEEYPSFVSKDFLNACLGIARGSLFFYQYGDGESLSDMDTEGYLLSLVAEPVSI